MCVFLKTCLGVEKVLTSDYISIWFAFCREEYRLSCQACAGAEYRGGSTSLMAKKNKLAEKMLV